MSPLADHDRVEGELFLGFIRSRLPVHLRIYWQFGLTILFVAVGVALLLFNTDSATDYARAFSIGTALYITPVSVQIARINWHYRKATGLTGALPAHITCLAAGTALYNIGFAIGFAGALLHTHGAPPSTLAPWVVSVANLFVIAGLNFIWRFVLLRRSQHA